MFIDDGVVSEIHEVSDNLFLITLMKDDINFRFSGVQLLKWGLIHNHIGLIKSCMRKGIKLKGSKEMLISALISNGRVDVFKLLVDLGFDFSRSAYYYSLLGKCFTCLPSTVSPTYVYDIGDGEEIKYIEILSKTYDGIEDLHKRIIEFLDLKDISIYCFPLCRVGDTVNDIVNGRQNSIRVTHKLLETIIPSKKFIPKIRVNNKMNSVKSFEIRGEVLFVHVNPTSRFGRVVRNSIDRGIDDVCLIGDYGFNGDELKICNINVQFNIPMLGL